MAGTGLSVYRGDSKSLRVDIVLPENFSYDLSDLRLVFTVKEDADAEAVLIQKQAVLNGSGFDLHLTPEETTLDPAQYPYDLELSNYSRTYVRTLVVGNFTVMRDITRTVV